MTMTVLKLTEGDCVVKIHGGAATTAIALATDLKKSNETVATPKVNITGITWAGVSAGTITINRNSVPIAVIVTTVPGQLDFSGNGMVADSIENESDISVVTTGTNTQLWLRLRKVSGYTSSNKLLTGAQL
jgi:hypothetical protein